MTITTLSSRAKKAATTGPVFITDRSRPAHVLLSIEECQRLTGGDQRIADALAMPDRETIDFEPLPIDIGLRPADLS